MLKALIKILSNQVGAIGVVQKESTIALEVEVTEGTNALLKEDEIFSGFFFETFSLDDCEIKSETDSVMYLLDINDYLSVLINYKELAMETMAVIESFDKHKTAIAI